MADVGITYTKEKVEDSHTHEYIILPNTQHKSCSSAPAEYNTVDSRSWVLCQNTCMETAQLPDEC